MPRKTDMPTESCVLKESLKNSYCRHLAYTRVRDEYTSTEHDQYYSLALAIREKIIDQWVEIGRAHV